jgi:predicted peptidase
VTRATAVRTARALTGLAALTLGLCRCAGPVAPPHPPSRQTKRLLATRAAPQGHLRYLLYVPADYDDVPTRRWPLLLFLHGDGERGDDLDQIKREGLPGWLDLWQHFPFLVVSPQCPSRQSWPLAALEELLDEILRSYRIDSTRLYATGLSGGATAAWELVIRDPGRFAAIAPVVTSREPRGDLCRARGVAVWAFHNRGDERIPVALEKRIAREFRACGGTIRLTIYPQEGHDAWSDTYIRQDLYAWLLAHVSEGSEPRNRSSEIGNR